MTDYEVKEANKYYWMVKGQLIPADWDTKDVAKIHESYFRRLWGNHEVCYAEEGFEEAWSKRWESNKQD